MWTDAQDSAWLATRLSYLWCAYQLDMARGREQDRGEDYVECERRWQKQLAQEWKWHPETKKYVRRCSGLRA